MKLVVFVYLSVALEYHLIDLLVHDLSSRQLAVSVLYLFIVQCDMCAGVYSRNIPISQCDMRVHIY